MRARGWPGNRSRPPPRPRSRLHKLCRTSVATHGDRVLMATHGIMPAAVETIGTGGTVSGNGQTGEAVETIGTGGTVETIGNKHRQLLQIRPRSRLLPSRHHPARTTRPYTTALLLVMPLWVPIGEGALQGSSRAPASVNNNNNNHRLLLPRLPRSRQWSSNQHSFHKNNHHRLLLPRRPRSRQFPPRQPPRRHQPACHHFRSRHDIAA